jgi:hypothetical protein
MTQHIDPQLTVLNYAQLEVKIFINVCALIVYNYIIPVYTVFIVYYLPVSVKKKMTVNTHLAPSYLPKQKKTTSLSLPYTKKIFMLSPAEVADFHWFIYKWPHYFFFFFNGRILERKLQKSRGWNWQQCVRYRL